LSGQGTTKRRHSDGSRPQPLPPVPRAPRLDTADRVRAELARIYRFCRAGHVPWETGTKAASILYSIYRMIEGAELEARLSALEQAAVETKAYE
jgi:hypothetical protein